MSQGDVLAITEQSDNVFRKVTYEALSEGRRIADSMGCGLTAVVLGAGENVAKELGQYGADRILVADNQILNEYMADAYTNVVAGIVSREKPATIVVGAST
ncbi:MAG: electron transfer flavoprotein subunit alpha/FixB family protein, partial [Thermodesulfobacteriota bacterium]|nr:electron transfer flavoprotein subunit alpha/FixB family protein [Thermodesulfobacteriota bacterium]